MQPKPSAGPEHGSPPPTDGTRGRYAFDSADRLDSSTELAALDHVAVALVKLGDAVLMPLPRAVLTAARKLRRWGSTPPPA